MIILSLRFNFYTLRFLFLFIKFINKKKKEMLKKYTKNCIKDHYNIGKLMKRRLPWFHNFILVSDCKNVTQLLCGLKIMVYHHIYFVKLYFYAISIL